MLQTEHIVRLANAFLAQDISTLVAVAVSLTLCAVGGNVFYNIYLHPLADYPGPKLAAISRLWYCNYCLRGQLPFVLLKVHERYGNVVRIAPDELSYTNPDGWNDIYGHRPGKRELSKDPVFYSSISSGSGSIVNADRARHGLLRKQMSHGFSEKALRDQEGVVRKYADLFLQRLNENCANGAVALNMVMWYNFFTFDVMGDLVFSQSFNCLESSKYHPWVQVIFDSVKMAAFLRCSKYWGLLTNLVSKFIPEDLKQRRVAQRAMAKQMGDNRKAMKEEKLDLISGFLKPDSGITDQEYQSSVQTLIIAGSETTATLMSGVTYYLLTNPDKMQKVVTEIRSAFKSPENITFVSVNNLSYLLACLSETLRLYPPVVDGLPRNTGHEPEIICGRNVPPHTIIRMSHWATYHSSENFTNPHDFIPERWLDDSAFQDDNKAALQPFHVGPRNCIGRNLAFMEMRLLMALLLYNFDLELAPESKSWDHQKVYLVWEKPDLMVKVKPRIENN